jgi:protein-disulfide isomerase
MSSNNTIIVAHNAIGRVTSRLAAAISPNGGLSNWAFITATIVAVLAAVGMIFLGRISYSKPDFSLLASNINSPGVTNLTPLLTGISGEASSSPAFIYGTSIGSLDAPVTIVVYSDFQCGICQKFALTIEKQLEKAYVETGKVRYIYKHFIVHDNDSLLAAEAAECAAEQNLFWPYHDLLMKARPSSNVTDITVDYLASVAQQLGLDMATFNASLESGKYQEKVMQDDAEGRTLGVTGPPTFFINRMRGKGFHSFEAFQQVIEDQIRRNAS